MNVKYSASRQFQTDLQRIFHQLLRCDPMFSWTSTTRHGANMIPKDFRQMTCFHSAFLVLRASSQLSPWVGDVFFNGERKSFGSWFWSGHTPPWLIMLWRIWVKLYNWRGIGLALLFSWGRDWNYSAAKTIADRNGQQNLTRKLWLLWDLCFFLYPCGISSPVINFLSFKYSLWLHFMVLHLYCDCLAIFIFYQLLFR